MGSKTVHDFIFNFRCVDVNDSESLKDLLSGVSALPQGSSAVNPGTQQGSPAGIPTTQQSSSSLAQSLDPQLLLALMGKALIDVSNIHGK